MPLSKKRKKPEKREERARGDAGAAAAPAAPAAESGGGLLTRMRGGIRTGAGAGPAKKESAASRILTWALVAVAAWFVAKRLGILP